jgi:uncharacterized protein YuzE
MEKLVSYDKEHDILFIHKGFASDEKFKGNVDVGDIVLDVSTKGRIVGIEFMNASQLFKEFDISKETFENIADADFNAAIKPNSIIIGLTFKVKNVKKEIPAKIAVPLETPIKC